MGLYIGSDTNGTKILHIVNGKADETTIVSPTPIENTIFHSNSNLITIDDIEDFELDFYVRADGPDIRYYIPYQPVSAQYQNYLLDASKFVIPLGEMPDGSFIPLGNLSGGNLFWYEAYNTWCYYWQGYYVRRELPGIASLKTVRTSGTTVVHYYKRVVHIYCSVVDMSGTPNEIDISLSGFKVNGKNLEDYEWLLAMPPPFGTQDTKYDLYNSSFSLIRANSAVVPDASKVLGIYSDKIIRFLSADTIDHYVVAGQSGHSRVLDTENLQYTITVVENYPTTYGVVAYALPLYPNVTHYRVAVKVGIFSFDGGIGKYVGGIGMAHLLIEKNVTRNYKVLVISGNVLNEPVEPIQVTISYNSTTNKLTANYTYWGFPLTPWLGGKVTPIIMGS